MLITVIFGSNSGEKRSYIEKAMHLLASETGEITAASSFYETEPWGFESDESFLNRVATYKTLLSPAEFLQKALAIENKLGRTRSPEIRYTSRTIDIDLLFCDSLSIHTTNLTIPHPRIAERKFVLVPLQEIMPDFVHPVLGKKISALLAETPDQLLVKKSDEERNEPIPRRT